MALGSGSLANVANTVSVGTSTARRRIVNVAPGIANSDVPTLGQVKNIAAAAEIANADAQQEVAKLRTLVKQQQQELAALKDQKAAALRQ
ncbi:MAG TPA: hypothetical protein VFK79_11810 [Xanthobacteraceae bacterium]|nr:hypothetical protein [Xanthobacteraceae bacterium]